ncbi:MAG: hypothetical protein QOF60_1059 [Actinomycetota bacterium]|jgi:hypothetical protein|nr:hypothetical protein [Actinomycetota bacterium]
MCFGCGVLLDTDVDEVVDGEAAGDDEGAVGVVFDGEYVAAGLVVDPPDEFLEEVLDGHDAVGSAVLVDDDHQLLSFELHLAQRVEHLHRVGQEHCRGRALTDRPSVGDDVTQVHHPDHVVEVPAVRDRRPRARLWSLPDRLKLSCVADVLRGPRFRTIK